MSHDREFAPKVREQFEMSYTRAVEQAKKENAARMARALLDIAGEHELDHGLDIKTVPSKR